MRPSPRNGTGDPPTAGTLCALKRGASHVATLGRALKCSQRWCLDHNAHSRAAPAGFARESRLPAGFAREPRLLSAFLLWCYGIIEPRSAKDVAAKPLSAFKMIEGPRHMQRRMKKRFTVMTKGLKAKHIKKHGAGPLPPNRKGLIKSNQELFSGVH